MSDENESSEDDPFGCLVVIFAAIIMFGGFPIIGILFPTVRETRLGETIFGFYSGTLGVEFPVFPIGPLLVVGTYLILIVGVFIFFAIIAARALQALFDIENMNIQLWGAIASILGLAIGILTLLKDKF